MPANRSLTQDIPAHLRLLFISAKPGVLAREEVTALAAQVSDWPALLAAANDQCVRPLFHRALYGASFAGVPAQWRQALEQSLRQLLKQNLAFTAELLHIVDVLDHAEVECIPYKGPILALQAYRDIGLREFMDVDILVRQRDIPRVTAAMSDAGYPLFSPSEAPTPVDSTAIPGQYHFAKPPEFLPIEFHTEQTLRYYPAPVDFDRFLSHLSVVAFGGQSLRAFSPELTLSILSVHGSKHLWNRLQWIADLAWLLHSTSSFDWNSALATANELGAEKMVFTGLALASGLLDFALPGEIAAKIKSDEDVTFLAAQSAREMFHPARAAANAAQRAAFRVRSAPTRGSGFRHLLRLATSPTEEDRPEGSTSKLGSILSRPVRLARKYGLGTQRRAEPDLAPFAQTPQSVIDAMLALAAPQASDVLYDLGCGDGAIVVRAAETFGLRAVGFDLDSALLSRARKSAQERGVADRVEFRYQDVKTVDLSGATIVTLFLSISGNLLLLPHLESQLKPDARIVSARFDFPGSTPDATARITIPSEKPWNIYLWRAAGLTHPPGATTATLR